MDTAARRKQAARERRTIYLSETGRLDTLLAELRCEVTAGVVRVRIDRQTTGKHFLTARVVQEAADGPVYGSNLLTGHQFSAVGSAQRWAEKILGDDVAAIIWEIED